LPTEGGAQRLELLRSLSKGTGSSCVRLYTLEREAFLEAVTGHAQGAEAADAVTHARLADQDRRKGPTTS
jgi:hypothetical protein